MCSTRKSLEILTKFIKKGDMTPKFRIYIQV